MNAQLTAWADATSLIFKENIIPSNHKARYAMGDAVEIYNAQDKIFRAANFLVIGAIGIGRIF
jgi:hypothetical protein